MKQRIEMLTELNLAGKRITMSFTNNRTKELWQEFMAQRAAIKNRFGPEFYSVEVYHDTAFFNNFNPNNEFEKWAAVRVKDHN